MYRSFLTFTLAALVALTISAPTDASVESGTHAVPVSGSGIDHLNTALVHSVEATPTGEIVKSTQIVELKGDLNGRVLYHVTSVFDFVSGTLVNTGDQVYSGTILGSAPVMIHDDRFRFEVDLISGKEIGKVFLFNHIAGPRVRCELELTESTLTPEGNPAFGYTGLCWFRGNE